MSDSKFLETGDLGDVFRIISDFECAVVLLLKNAHRLDILAPKLDKAHRRWQHKLAKLFGELHRHASAAIQRSSPNVSQLMALPDRLFVVNKRIMEAFSGGGAGPDRPNTIRYPQAHHPKDDVRPQGTHGKASKQPPKNKTKKALRRRKFVDYKKAGVAVQKREKALERARAHFEKLSLSFKKKSSAAENEKSAGEESAGADGGGGGEA